MSGVIESLSLALTLCSAVSAQCAKVSLLKAEAGRLRFLVDTLSPLLKEYLEELRNGLGQGDRPEVWVTSLNRALEEGKATVAQDVVSIDAPPIP